MEIQNQNQTMNGNAESATQPSNQQQDTLLVIDGHSLAFRAYFALPVENFSTSEGQATNAVWGFATMLAQVVEAERPQHLAVAFDVKGGTFRNQMLPQYKGTRDAAPEDLLSQLPLIQQLLTALGIIFIEKPGYEGDDIIGTLASMGEAAGYRTLVLSGDRDAFQLVDDNITVLYPGHHFKDLKHMTPQAVLEKYHVSAQQYPDLAAMRGETADNIPGVPGVGDGFAAKWINQYGSLNGIIEHADEIKGKKGEALRENIEQVRLNRKVNALVRDLDLGVPIEDFAFGNIDTQQLNDVLATLEFGGRTKQRLVSTFSGYTRHDDGGDAQAIATNHGTNGSAFDLGDENPDIANIAMENADSQNDVASRSANPITQTNTIASAQELNSWVESHLLGFVEDTAKGVDAEAEPPVNRSGTSDEDADVAVDPSSHSRQQDARQMIVDSSEQCNGSIAFTWVLYAQGSPKPGHASMTSIVIFVDGHAAVIDGNSDNDLRHALQMLIDDHHTSMITHGYKEQCHIFATANINLSQPKFDTKLAGYLVQPDFHADTLEQAASRFLELDIETPDAVSQGELDLDDENDEPQEHALAVHQGELIRELANALAPKIDARKQFGLLRSIELPVSDVLFGMEYAGAHVNVERLYTMRDMFGAQADQAQRIAWESAGTQVNLQSPKQLQHVLFEDMGLQPTRKTKSGSYTTNAASLQELYVKSANSNERANTFLGALLQHRETNKLKQIVQTLIDSTNVHDHRIHTTFEQTVAATGRLSSVDPNLQNIPNRNAAGREIRSAFVPGEGFESLLSCDYSQVELRLMADFSGDEALIEAFKSGTDFHKYVASLVYELPVEEITSDQRSHVKAMSYGLAYGLSTYGLSQQLKISPAAADVLKEKYFATFGKVHTYLESLVSMAKRKGYTETMFARRRYFPGLASRNRVARDAAERGALNAPIQGSAADIMKLAMIRADHALREAGVKSRIILQIHDELVVEIAPGEAEKVSTLVKNAMEHAVDLAVPLDVSTGLGADWQLAAH